MTIKDLFGDGFGPVSTRGTRQGLVATFEGVDVTLRDEGEAVRADARVATPWPDRPDVQDRLDAQLVDLAVARGDLVVVRSDATSRAVDVSAWIPADGITPFDVALLVRAVATLADLVDRLVGAVATQYELEDQLAADTAAMAGAVGAPPGADGPPPATPTVWGYVDRPTEVRGVGDTNRVVGQLVPGTWYRVGETNGPWTRVTSSDGAVDGWAAATSVQRRDGPG